jgi:heme exporter protein C
MKQLLSLKHSYFFARRWLPLFLLLAIALFCYGSFSGLFLAPPDYQQGQGFRIIYVHVPSAFWSLAIYTIIFINSLVFLIWRLKLSDVIASASAPVGATYTFIALITGAIWGKPMWGTWWVWDARLTSELILLFLYLGYMGLRSATHNSQLKGKMAGILAVIGMINVPIIHFSVEWWHTLHQGSTLLKLAKPSMPAPMLIPLLVMILAFGCFYIALLLIRMRAEILEREFCSDWLRDWIGAKNNA